MTITDLYKQLFGRKGIADGDVISMAEHGRSGGVSTGQGFKFTDTVTYATEMDYAGGSNPVYIGLANPGTATSEAAWQIKKLTYDTSGNLTTIQLANSAPNFDQVWDDRSSLTYA